MSRNAAHRGALHLDEHGLVTGFVVKALVVFALLGLAAKETGQIVLTEVRAGSAAGAAAQAGADNFARTKSVKAARRAALQAAAAKDASAHVTAISVATDGAVTVTVTETAPTIVVRRVSILRRFGVVHATKEESHSLA